MIISIQLPQTHLDDSARALILVRPCRGANVDLSSAWLKAHRGTFVKGTPVFMNELLTQLVERREYKNQKTYYSGVVDLSLNADPSRGLVQQRRAAVLHPSQSRESMRSAESSDRIDRLVKHPCD